METKFNTIEEILEDLRQGKIVMMMDDEDRENEGDVICAAEHATLCQRTDLYADVTGVYR